MLSSHAGPGPGIVARLLRSESAPGMLLVAAGVVALLLANSPFAGWFDELWAMPISVRAGSLLLDKHLLHWINDGLMAVFFLIVGLELKRELVDGELAEMRKVALPAFGAIGGMLVPALVYAFFNRGDSEALRGWAIPCATDIAFALGVLTLFGSRVPPALKLFLLTLAILDDLGAIVVIAIFYTSDLSGPALILAAILLALLAVMNRAGVRRIALYLIVGVVLWACVLKSGVHATLAGVAVALALPLRTPFADEESISPALSLEHRLRPFVAFGILPLFALANAGVSLAGLPPGSLLSPVTLGITLGLLAGKVCGVFSFSVLAIALRAAVMPDGVTRSQLFGASLLCGIGFTMSLFIASLAFGEHGSPLGVTARLGILLGSLLSAIAGSAWLARALPR